MMAMLPSDFGRHHPANMQQPSVSNAVPSEAKGGGQGTSNRSQGTPLNVDVVNANHVDYDVISEMSESMSKVSLSSWENGGSSLSLVSPVSPVSSSISLASPLGPSRVREFNLSDVKNSNVSCENTSVNGDVGATSEDEGKVLGRPLSVTFTLIGTCVVGLRNEIILQVIYADVPRTILRTKLLKVSAVNGEKKHKVICQLKPSRRGTRVYFWPRHIDVCYFTVGSDGCQDFTFNLEVEGNNPVLSFAEDNDWPVAIAVRQDDHTIYVAFMHHVSKYDGAGDFTKEVLRERFIHFNDIAVDQLRHRLAVSVSGWRKDGTHKFRYQVVRVYSITGTPLWAVGRQHPLFGVSIIRIAFDPQGNLLVASKDALCTCARSTGVVDKRVEAKFGTAARMAITEDGNVVVADGNRGHIYVFDESICPKSDFAIQLDPPLPTDGNVVVGLTGLSVDRFGHIIVSECLTSSIQVYMLDGTLLVLIDSEWDMCKWPLALAVSRDGHVFVADHGNACIKKYRYM